MNPKLSFTLIAHLVLWSSFVCGFASTASGEIIVMSQSPGDELVGGETLLVDLFLDFEGSDAGLAVVAGNAIGSSNINFVDYSVEAPAVKVNENDFNVALFYPFPDLLAGPEVAKILTIKFETTAVSSHTTEVIEFNLDNGGGFFFDRTTGLPVTGNESLEIRLLAKAVPELSSCSLIAFGFGVAALRRRRRGIHERLNPQFSSLRFRLGDA